MNKAPRSRYEKERRRSVSEQSLSGRNKANAESFALKEGLKYKVKYSRKEYRDEYLLSAEWSALRRSALNLESKCYLCGHKGSLDVHHMDYRNIVDVTLECLVALCRPCHSMVHDAIDMGLLEKKHTRQSLSKMSHSLVSSEKKRLNQKSLLPRDLIKRIVAIPFHRRQMLCAKLKIPFKMESEWYKLVLSGRDQQIIRAFL